MKVKSSEQVLDYLDKDKAWRIKEILNLKHRLELSSKFDAETMAKCLVVISYSHWEGFVKNAASIYLTYIKNVANNPSGLSKQLKASLISWNFSIDYKAMIDKIGLINRKLSGIEKYNFHIKEMCSTESNLSYEVLQKILYSIGIDTTSFDSKRNYINETILGNRNAIAHGEQRERLSKEESLKIADIVIELISNFKTEIENAIALKIWMA